MHHPLVNIGINAAREAGKVITQSLYRIGDLDVTEKQRNDYVSEVDIMAERVIIDMIHKAYPDHAILAEESGPSGENEVQWIIDPLDGTRNYLHGFPHYAISIGIKENNRLQHGIIYDPMRKEMFSATRGGGARLNAQRIRVSKNSHLNKALLATGFPFRDKDLFKTYLSTFEAIFTECGGVRRAGSAALDLAYVACGRLDGFWEFGLAPWDIAAGIVLIREAGGLVCDFDGGEDFLKSGNVIAGNPKMMKNLLQTIQPLTRLAQ